MYKYSPSHQATISFFKLSFPDFHRLSRLTCCLFLTLMTVLGLRIVFVLYFFYYSELFCYFALVLRAAW